MNKSMKRLISVVMAVILVALTATPAFASLNANGEVLPIVYVIGKVDVIYKDKDDPNSKVIYPVSFDGLSTDNLMDLGEKFLYAYSHNKNEQAWDEYCDAMYRLISDIYEDLTLGPDGEPKDNSGIIWDWKSDLKDTRENGVYGLEDYMFHYDWRRDMFYNAELLDEYINAVLEVTNSEKCILVSRCYGCNLVTAYMSQYGTDKIDTNIFYCSTANGSIVCSEMFSGEIQINADGLGIYLEELFGVNPVTAILGKALTSSQIGLTLTSAFVNAVYQKIADRVMPRSLISSFASMPGYWSMVNEEHFDKAKEFVFGDDTETYSELIKKIDKYHYQVFNKTERMIVNSVNSGMKYANITKYGSQIVPAIKNCDYIGDGIVEVPCASFGATSVKKGESFSADYLNKAVENGTIDYISTDYMIDASTALYPDYTWFAEGVEHFDFPKSVDKLILAIARYRGSGQMDVYTDAEFPQFRSYDGEGNMMTWAMNGYLNNSTDSLARLMNMLIKFFSFISSIFSSITG